MSKIFKLSEIGKMKFQQVAWLTREILDAKNKGHDSHAAACERELIQTKYEATHPETVWNG